MAPLIARRSLSRRGNSGPSSMPANMRHSKISSARKSGRPTVMRFEPLTVALMVSPSMSSSAARATSARRQPRPNVMRTMSRSRRSVHVSAGTLSSFSTSASS
jgi:hypothetical protein